MPRLKQYSSADAQQEGAHKGLQERAADIGLFYRLLCDLYNCHVSPLLLHFAI
jgi:hypothetical protein